MSAVAAAGGPSGALDKQQQLIDGLRAALDILTGTAEPVGLPGVDPQLTAVVGEISDELARYRAGNLAIPNSHAASVRVGVDQLIDEVAKHPDHLDDLAQDFAVGVDHTHQLWIVKVYRVALYVANVLKLRFRQIDELVNRGAQRVRVGHQISPSFGNGPTGSVGERPGPAEEAGPGQAPGGAAS